VKDNSTTSQIRHKKKPIGFIGLGRMGSGMAKSLLKAGIILIVFDTNKKAMERLTSLGALSGNNPENIANQVDLVFLCLPFAPQVDKVLFGKHGITSKPRSNLSIIDTSTLSPEDASNFSNLLQKFKINYSDCPVSGMPFRAQNGTLTMMFGGDQSAFSQTKPFLKIMGKYIIYCGKCGSGQMMKSFNNIVYNINIAAISEILPLAVKAGLKPSALEQVFTSASSQSFASKYFIPRILNREFDTDFAMIDAYKDIINVQKIATKLQGSIPVTNAMISTYQNTMAIGLQKKPKSAMIKLYEKILNVIVKRD